MLHDERRGRRGRERLLALRAHKAQRGKGRRRRITEGQGDLTSEWGTHCLAAQGVYCWPPPWGVVDGVCCWPPPWGFYQWSLLTNEF